MFNLLTASDSYVQFITVLVVFILVLAVTAFVMRWIANYQKQQTVNNNIELVETSALGNNKWVQIVRVGETYWVIATCKESVTLLGEVPKEQLKERESGGANLNFKELFDKAIKRDSTNDCREPKD